MYPIDRFYRQAKLDPKALAVACGDDRVNYRDLYTRNFG